MALALASACSDDKSQKGDQGDQGAPGDAGTPGPTGPEFMTAESCAVCHGTGQLEADEVALHATLKTRSLAYNVAKITSVALNQGNAATATGDNPIVVFTVKDSAGSPVTGLAAVIGTVKPSFRFTMAKLVDGPAGTKDWQSYLNKNTSSGYKQAAAESWAVGGSSQGTLTESPAGTYTFTSKYKLSSTPVALSTTTAVTEAYTDTAITRFALQSGTSTSVVAPFNAAFDYDPSLGDTQTTTAADPHQLVKTANCNACHQKLAVHGGTRLDVEYCVTCHNPGTSDPAGVTVDLKVMTHKIHMGKDLPSVLAGGTYSVIGYGNAVHDYSLVAFPQDVGNCLACHGAPPVLTGTAPPAPTSGNNFKNNPTIATCTSCHDRTSFAEPLATGYTLHKGGTNGGAAYVDADCARCHTAGGSEHTAPIELFHAIPATVDFKYSIVGVTGTAPGESPAVTVLVTNAAGMTPHKLNASGGNAADVPWAQTSNGASRLAVVIGWSTTAVTSPSETNYTNEGSGGKAGQPVSLDVLKNGVYNSADGSYTVTSTVAIPANAVGVGLVALEGHPADGQGNRIAVQNVTKTFAITGTDTTVRRAVVDINKCNLCHQNLSLHGNNRTSSIETCVICHNANATDISRRPTDGTATADGKAEESVDFKMLIHGIHGALFSGAGPVVYGFGSSVNDFRKAGYPGYLSNCDACHNSGTYGVSFPPANGTTTSTSGDPLTPAGFLRTTTVTAACSSCHATVPDRGHMEQNGGAFGVTQAQIDAVNQ
ncbi:MAG: hypothetical protein A2V77_12230 [Anaeromyxobacter sp. RBG_16_69_14]|nr:MAG: hypothetical protein A2V77_12230 [Anaeromyxobacter sp. RBG_16_69_14]